MNKFTRFFLVTALSLFMFSCSLLKLELETGTVPLAKSDLNLRVALRSFTPKFFNTIETAADSIYKQSANPKIKANAILWKINSETTAQKTIYQTQSVEALVDTWVFTKQMYQFLNNNRGNKLFGDYQSIALNAAMDLNLDMSSLARKMLTPKMFKQTQLFIADYAEKNPLKSISFTRQPIRSEWLSYQNSTDSTAVKTFGTLPEVMNDFSGQIKLMSEQIPKTVQWQTELMLMNSGVDTLDLYKVADSINNKVERFLKVAENSPELINQAAEALNKELLPLMKMYDNSMNAAMEKLTLERKALVENFASEREIIMNDLDSISVNVTEVAIREVKTMIDDILFYVVLILFVILFIPFGLGFLTGRAMKSKKQK